MPGSGFAPCKENGKAGQEGMYPPFPLRPRHIFRDCPWAVKPTEGSNAQIALKNGHRFSGEQNFAVQNFNFDDSSSFGSLVGDQIGLMQLVFPIRVQTAMGRTRHIIFGEALGRRKETGDKVKILCMGSARDDHAADGQFPISPISGVNFLTISSDGTSVKSSNRLFPTYTGSTTAPGSEPPWPASGFSRHIPAQPLRPSPANQGRAFALGAWMETPIEPSHPQALIAGRRSLYGRQSDSLFPHARSPTEKTNSPAFHVSKSGFRPQG